MDNLLIFNLDHISFLFTSLRYSIKIIIHFVSPRTSIIMHTRKKYIRYKYDVCNIIYTPMERKINFVL